MKCFECEKENKKTDTIGICIICGRGICEEHYVREKVPVWEGEYEIRLKCMGDACEIDDMQPLLKIICNPCHEALTENS
ncbi:DUF2180 family protein [Methanohalophilus portucalensis]|uniref:DUF2180 family protein n=2 Tax=Methanohalophilus portucalensis TaxID=39664 RepID=A0A1L9C4L6_9EURY|nr:DUF2180 family protein [Methanohalophilus portucalensis]ATU07720.1 hypothetical protein BKM01_02365 [Methanohalophilus portucalensis]OJH49474.1 hypothetical protein MPF_1341 [Methanohalophilus portucalensis FDF-1]RNI11432.1 DUF2180 family protein [Methanohalophilus portucalensis FDF-1]SMH40703.1 hypothetical protein SAMN06264941_1534 [Methanohalophilus portucalensis FDF-1]